MWPGQGSFRGVLSNYGTRFVTVPDTPTPMGQLLQHRLSSERLKPYVTAAQGDLDRAAELYEWNAEVASAFHLVVGHFEVVLRNALHGQLTIWHHNRGRTGE